MNTVIQKYAAALLPFLIFLLGAVQVVLPDGISDVEAWDLAALIAGAVVTFFVPLVNGPWSGLLKTGAALVAAAATAIVPLLIPGAQWTGAQTLIVALAVLNALATQVGVAVRLDGAKAAINATLDVRDTVGVPSITSVLDAPALAIVSGKHAASV